MGSVVGGMVDVTVGKGFGRFFIVDRVYWIYVLVSAELRIVQRFQYHWRCSRHHYDQPSEMPRGRNNIHGKRQCFVIPAHADVKRMTDR